MKVKVSEATPQQLDWLVEKCEYDAMPFVKAWVKERHLAGDVFTQASTDWSQGGPIIEREGLGLWYSANVVDENGTFLRDAGWYCETAGGTFAVVGPTPLIAAMRCYVTSKLGDEVDVPKVLCEKP